MKYIYIALSLVYLLAGVSIAGHWQMEGHMPQGPLEDMAVNGVQIAGNTMISVMGGQSGGNATNSAFYYDIANKIWHDSTWGVPQYPHPVNGLAAVTVSNGGNDTIYSNGGYLQDLTALGDSTYYPNWGSGWFAFATMTMLTPRMNHGLVSLYGHHLYAVGGNKPGGTIDSTVEQLDIHGGPPLYVKDMPQSRTEAVVVKAVGADAKEHIYVIGGRTNSGALLNSVIEYDSSGAGGGTWLGRMSMPGPGRWMATGAVMNNKIYVMGGALDLGTSTVTRRVDIYDPTTDSWTMGDSLPLQMIRAGAYGVNNVIYFFGGFDRGTGTQSDSIWEYRPLAPNSPPLIRPLPNAQTNNQSPVFVWGSVPTAGQYRIQVSTDPSFTVIDVVDYLAPTGTDTTLGGVTLSPAGDFYWRVKSYNWSVPDSSLWSPVRRLTLDTDPPAQPVPSAPMDGSYTNSTGINFSWSAVADARRYSLQVDNTDGTFINLIVNDSTITSNSLVIDMSPWGGNGHYTWRVEAIDSAGNVSGYHSIQTFTIDMTAPYVPYTDPYNGENAVQVDRQITVAFSEPVQQGTQFSFSCTPNPGATGWIMNWNSSCDTVWFSHDNFASNTSYTFQVNAMDLANNSLTGGQYSWSFVTEVNDITPPTIGTISASSDQLFAGTSYVFTAYITDGVKMGSATLNWGPAGSVAFTNHPMSLNGGGYYEVTISGSDIPARGVRYQIDAVDSSGNHSYYPNTAGAGYDWYNHSVNFAGFVPTTPLGYDQWQMISIPADARSTNIFGQLSNDLGAYDNTKWRLFIWGSGGYGEISSFSSGSIITLGQAYWLRHRTTQTAVSFEGPGHSYGNFNESQVCSLALAPGWNDLGTPFLFDRDWAMHVTIPANVAGPYYYDGTRWLLPSEVTNGSLPFKPYLGFSFRNDAASNYLEICPAAKKKSGKTAAEKQPNGWQALVAVGNQNGSDNNYFGLSTDASVQRDQYDYPEPPSGLTGTSGYFRLVNDQFCTDVRPELGDGQTWSFAVDCNGRTSLTITLPGGFPAGAECYLADLSRQVSVNIRDNGTYSFTPEPGEKTREFRIIAGQADYAKGVLGSAFALPAVTLLGQNRPNPLRDNTAISYQLAATGPAKLAVYNVAGQLVKTLVNRPQMAGRYTVNWNGRDESGRQAAAGVYFYRLTANGTSAARTMNLIK
jgi:hypothetical protein